MRAKRRQVAIRFFIATAKFPMKQGKKPPTATSGRKNGKATVSKKKVRA